MKRSIYFKNFRTTAGIVLLSFVVLGGLFSAWSYRSIVGNRRESMTSAARETLRYVTAQSMYYGSELEGFEIRMALSMISRASGFDIIITNADGVVISCSDEELICAHIGKRISREAVDTMLAGHGYDAASKSEVYGEERYFVGVIIPGEDAHGTYVLGYLFVSVGTEELADMWKQFSSIFMFLALMVLGITFIVSFLTTKRQAEPLNDMARAARKFARGDFAVRVSDVTSDDEIGELAQAFNSMADAMEKAETRRRELIANVSHELKTPMTVIAGFADGILDGTIPPESEAKYLGVISSETRRLSRLVRSLLDMSQLNSPQAAITRGESFDIAELIRVTLVGMFAKLESKQIEAVPELPEEPVVVLGNKDSITQVVYNLLDNAVKFANAGSELKIALWKQGERAFVSIEDEGLTIPEDELPLIFERFHKTDRSRGVDRDGIGLGLYIVKTILDHHNEDIFVTSADGLTKFTFTMTVAPQKRAKTDKSEPKNA
ncbi:MAG: HAMP domain-containing histidine kinase [Oscillospiraceae bacterium]|jgi:signal transduction histidine kinase|nr:HAMP domain-containing histidine kinase [Oscillospiraceae bacterium]